MHEVVGDKLADVLVHVLVSVREMHRPAARHASVGRCEGAAGRSSGSRGRFVAEQVALELVADLGDGLALEQGRRPQALAHDVVHESPDIPFLTRRRQLPLVRTDRRHAGHPAVHSSPVLVDEIHASLLTLPSQRAPLGAGRLVSRVRS